MIKSENILVWKLYPVTSSHIEDVKEMSLLCRMFQFAELYWDTFILLALGNSVRNLLEYTYNEHFFSVNSYLLFHVILWQPGNRTFILCMHLSASVTKHLKLKAEVWSLSQEVKGR